MRKLKPTSLGPGHTDYSDLVLIAVEVDKRLGVGGAKARFPLLCRDALDLVLDSVRTARTRLDDLDNVEKTFVGLKLEHLIRDTLDVPKGVRDLHICGKDVDIKNTVHDNWMIPPETYNNSEPCLLMAVDEVKHTCFLGVIIAKRSYLHGGEGNRDSKRGVSAEGFDNIFWIVRDEPFPPSRFSAIDMVRFRELRKIEGGNERAAQFFRENLRLVIHRDVVHGLLFDHYDYMKRIRAGKGAPDILRKEEIAILIGTYRKDRDLATQLGIPDLKSNEVVGVSPRDESERALLKSAGDID